MTIEQLNEKLKAEVETIKAEATAATSKLLDAEKIMAEAKFELTAFAELKIEAAKKDEALKVALARIAELEAQAKPAELQAAAIVAACGTDPAFVTPDVPANAGAKAEVSILDKWNSLAGPERQAFYRANKDAIQAAKLALASGFTPFKS